MASGRETYKPVGGIGALLLIPHDFLDAPMVTFS